MDKKIDFSKLVPVTSPICENCDGVIVDGKCNGIRKMKGANSIPCPQRFKDKYMDWYRY